MANFVSRETAYWSNLGEVCERQDQLDAAAEHFGRALGLQPELWQLWYNLGNVRKRQGHFQDATTCYREAIRLNPNDAAIHNNLAIALVGQDCRFHENLEEAVSHFRAALEISPGDEGTAANVAAAQGNLDKLSVVQDFHKLYYRSYILQRTYWLGILTSKHPTDLWVYQEILWETRPELIVEAGTFEGGSALYLASICDLLGTGEVVTIDIEHRQNRPAHPRIRYVLGSSLEERTIEMVRASAKRIMVILDSDHSQAHVARELELYAPLVTPGCYLIVEDTNPNAYPMFPKGTGPGGPAEAVAGFLPDHPEFEVDRSREKFFTTGNPGGYLKKKLR